LSAAAYLFIFPSSLNGRVSTIADPYSKSNKARIYMIETGLKISADNPVFGVGSINLRNVYQNYRKITITGEGEQLHNNMMQLLVTMGIPGLVIWLLIMTALLLKQINIYKFTRNNDTLNLLTVCSLASMLQFQICGLIDWNFGDYAIVVIFWFMMSMAFLAEKFYNDPSRAEMNIK
jgi:O-antigen ligase